jgi:hypothetical protein
VYIEREEWYRGLVRHLGGLGLTLGQPLLRRLQEALRQTRLDPALHRHTSLCHGEPRRVFTCVCRQRFSASAARVRSVSTCRSSSPVSARRADWSCTKHKSHVIHATPTQRRRCAGGRAGVGLYQPRPAGLSAAGGCWPRGRPSSPANRTTGVAPSADEAILRNSLMIVSLKFLCYQAPT